MSLKTRLSGVWKHVRASVKVSGTWKDVPQAYVKVGDAWKPLYTFSWETGAFGYVSALRRSAGLMCRMLQSAKRLSVLGWPTPRS